MVRLEKIEMAGFKSFLSTTEFVFGPGITAVVGPNGCGKSNIADAIHWVIGERSSKTLRADHMGDVIFNGTDNRRPLGMAEVSLHLSEPALVLSGEFGNGNGDGNGDGPDGRAAAGEGATDSVPICITRRLFRSGESEYLIDGQKRRLKDIQELLARLGVGTGLYAIIEQGKIDSIITARPRDRRMLVEEAAGIALFKIRKRQAQSKLESTEANLSRINDVVSELERQIGSLKRQAARARRFARINEGIDRAERILFHHESLQIDERGADLGVRRDAARTGESGAAAAMGSAEAELQAVREAAAAGSLRRQEARDALHELDRTLDALRRGVERSREQRVAAETQIERLARETSEIRRRLEEGEARHSGLADRLAEADADQRSIEASLESAEAVLRLDGAALQSDETSLAALRDDLVAAAAEVSEVRSEIRRLEESCGRLSALAERLAGESAGADSESAELSDRRTRHEEILEEASTRHAHAVKEAAAAANLLAMETSRRERLLVDREQKRGLLSGLGERISALRELDAAGAAALAAGDGQEGVRLRLIKDEIAPPEALDRAVDAALGGLLRGYLVETSADAAILLGRLKETGGGRAVVIPAETSGTERAAPPPSAEHCMGSLSALLGDRVASVPGLSSILRRVLVAETLEKALALRKTAPSFDVVTLQGDLVSRDGWMEGGAELPEEAGVMTLRRLLSRLASEIERTEGQITELEGAVQHADERLSVLRGTAAEWRERAEEVAREVEGLRLRGESLGEEGSRISMRREALAGEHGRTLEDLAAAVRSREAAESLLAAALNRRDELQRGVESLEGAMERLRETIRARGEALASLRERAAAARIHRASVETEARHLDELRSDLQARLASHEREQAEWTGQREEAGERLVADEQSLSDRMAERILAEGAVVSAEAAAQEQGQALQVLEAKVREARGALESARATVHALEIEEERLAGDRRNLEARVAEKGWMSLGAATADLSEEERSRPAPEVESELAEWKEKRDRLGPVNLMAMEQFRELEERYGFITAQRKDLEEAVRSLKETISRINRQSRERFMEAFESIRKNFSDLYPVLFRGGRADLRLDREEAAEGEEDILEAGLEISAQPPGKKLQSISLLSGGEKALTALALIFAIFRYSPSPFCLLDEVDAALDELNVARFVSLLGTMSAETQFLVITHSRRTMEAANMLYGVTMEEPGVSRTVSVVMGSPEQRAEAARSLPEQLAARHRGSGRTARRPSPSPPPEA